MDLELTALTWYWIARDLSFDAVRPYLPEMGLWRPVDALFATELRPLIKRFALLRPGNRRPDDFAASMVQLAAGHGPDYERRLRDWSVYIYPNHNARQRQIFLWRNVVMRGAGTLARDFQRSPPLIQAVRAFMRSYAPVKAGDPQPKSEWDLSMLADREDDGLSPFEWLETAIDIYRFLRCWDEATRGTSPAEPARAYQWAVREGEKLHIKGGGLEPPEQSLILPETLRIPRAPS